MTDSELGWVISAVGLLVFVFWLLASIGSQVLSIWVVGLGKA